MYLPRSPTFGRMDFTRDESVIFKTRSIRMVTRTYLFFVSHVHVYKNVLLLFAALSFFSFMSRHQEELSLSAKKRKNRTL